MISTPMLIARYGLHCKSLSAASGQLNYTWCLQVTIEEWMKFFNHQWSVSPDSVVCILEVMQKRLGLY